MSENTNAHATPCECPRRLDGSVIFDLAQHTRCPIHGICRTPWQRFRRWIDWKLNHRYYEHIPADIRALAEKHGVPKPNRWVPRG